MVGGAFIGVAITADYHRWSTIGRDAFLPYQGKRFDLYMAHPGSGWGPIVVGAILMLGLGAIYEGIAVGVERLFCLRPPKMESRS